MTDESLEKSGEVIFDVLFLLLELWVLPSEASQYNNKITRSLLFRGKVELCCDQRDPRDDQGGQGGGERLSWCAAISR